MYHVKSFCQIVIVICASVGLDSTALEKKDEMTVEDTKSSANISMPMIYRRELLNESLEKIQVFDKGVITKSAFVPLIKNYTLIDKKDNLKENLTEVKMENDNNSTLSELMPFKGNKGNFNIITRDGKKYKIIKIKKNFRRLERPDLNKNIIQKRSFKLPNFLSLLPKKWMTRIKKAGKSSEEGEADDIQWSKLAPIDTSKEITKNSYQGEKIKKLLNLFTIVKFNNNECFGNGVTGTCLLQNECGEKGGKFTNKCADIGVCCTFEKTCGQQSKENSTYFVNEGFPGSSSVAPKVCSLTVYKVDKDVKRLLLDFLTFELRGPVNGTCLHDKLVITGQDLNSIVPEICGGNTGQHIYVDVEDSVGPYSLNVITVGEYFPRNFRIKVTQIKNTDEIPPKNCLQYFTQPEGHVQSFNYQHQVNDNLDEIVTGYFNNLNYAICIRKHKGFCSITYNNEEPEDNIHPTFQMMNINEDGEKLLPPRQAGAETFDCPDDYIIVNGLRLCGEKLNDAMVEIDFTKNYPVIDTTNGPFILSVRTDAAISGRGFYLKYSQNPCFI